MLIELAHYTILFALTVAGLQAFLLCPTLWSGGSAVAIRQGFRGTSFTAFLLLLTFFILLHSFAVHDFSLAVVFETFDSQSGFIRVLPAFCSSREGFFFTFIIVLTTVFWNGFSKNELLTYQERGRYLFAGNCLIFLLLGLMLATANPFVRIEEPPFEGVGFPAEWNQPHHILSVLLSFGICACLTVSFIKTICIGSKGRQFVIPALHDNLIAFILLLCALGLELMTDFTDSDVATVWQWTPDNSLLLSVLLLTLGQIILLFFCRKSHLFTNWIIVFSLLGTALSAASFFAIEYRLFSQSESEAYFPNPVAALSAFAGFTCFLLFLCSVTLKKSFKENNISLFSRESFIGLTAATLLTASVSIGFLSLLPALFMFLPDLPLRLLPALFKTILYWTGAVATLFFFIAFLRQSVNTGWAPVNRKNLFFFWGIFFIFFCICFYKIPNGKQIALFSFPAVLILSTTVSKDSFKIPVSFDESVLWLKKLSSLKCGLFFCATGLLIFSAALSCTLLNGSETTETFQIQKIDENAFPCLVERLSEKIQTTATQYRLVCHSPVHLLSGDLNFRWPEKELKAKFLQTDRFSTRLLKIHQTREDTLNLTTEIYPALQLAGSGLFLMCLGALFLLLSVKKERLS